jgi:hypothetical protein
MQGDLGVVVADDHTMRQKRLVTAASKTKVGTPVLQAWKEMKCTIDTTKMLHRQRILTAQCLHRASSFTLRASSFTLCGVTNGGTLPPTNPFIRVGGFSPNIKAVDHVQHCVARSVLLLGMVGDADVAVVGGWEPRLTMTPFEDLQGTLFGKKRKIPRQTGLVGLVAQNLKISKSQLLS